MENGIIAIHKPEGISSAFVVACVKKKLRAKKTGHTGTLDPFATGLLLCAINKGTKISRFFLASQKRYIARVCLGIETDTYDLTGKTVFTAQKNAMAALKKQDIKDVVQSFAGVSYQVPPFFSALKHKGRPLYKLAREGKKIQKPARQIEIFDIKTKNIQLPCIDIDVSCSAGTYIRSLAFDIGKKLGCGAHLSRLCRTKSGSFKLEDAIKLDTFEKLDDKIAKKKIVSLLDCLCFMPKVEVDRSIAQKIRFGQKLLTKQFLPEAIKKGSDQFIKVLDDNKDLIAIIQLNKDRQEYNYSCVF